MRTVMKKMLVLAGLLLSGVMGHLAANYVSGVNGPYGDSCGDCRGTKNANGSIRVTCSYCATSKGKFSSKNTVTVFPGQLLRSNASGKLEQYGGVPGIEGDYKDKCINCLGTPNKQNNKLIGVKCGMCKNSKGAMIGSENTVTVAPEQLLRSNASGKLEQYGGVPGIEGDYKDKCINCLGTPNKQNNKLIGVKCGMC